MKIMAGKVLKKGIVQRFCIAVLVLLTACAKESLPPKEAWIKDAREEPVYLRVDGLENAGNEKLAIIQHGLASNMEHPAVQTAKKAFLDNGYVVVTFDARYSLGKSGNDVSKVRLQTFEEDLKMVVDWAGKQKFYHEPFALAGHSLGGAAVLLYAAENPAKVGQLVPITPVVSGRRWEDSCMVNMTDFCKNWKKNGFYNYQTAVIPYAVVEEAKSYDALKLAGGIKADTLLVTAEDDNVIRPRDVEELYKALPGQKSFEIVPQSGHNFQTGQNRQDLYKAIAGFLQAE